MWEAPFCNAASCAMDPGAPVARCSCRVIWSCVAGRPWGGSGGCNIKPCSCGLGLPGSAWVAGCLACAARFVAAAIVLRPGCRSRGRPLWFRALAAPEREGYRSIGRRGRLLTSNYLFNATVDPSPLKSGHRARRVNSGVRHRKKHG